MKRICMILAVLGILTLAVPVCGQEFWQKSRGYQYQAFKMNCVRNLEIHREVEDNSEEVKQAAQEVFIQGWTSANVNFREKPAQDGEVMEVISYNTEVMYTEYDNDWYEVLYGENRGYLHKRYLTDQKIQYRDFPGAKNTTKSFMPYTAITSTSSPQYKLQQKAYTGQYGIRQVDGRFCVAVGSYYTTAIGTYFDLILENGTVIPCILADCKSDRHTDASKRVTFDGSLAEFVVDADALVKRVWRSGNISSADESWNSPVKTVRIYDKKESVE